MNNILKSREFKKRLIKESNGSFSVVHKALREVQKETKSESLDIEKVVRRIKVLDSKKTKQAS